MFDYRDGKKSGNVDPRKEIFVLREIFLEEKKKRKRTENDFSA